MKLLPTKRKKRWGFRKKFFLRENFYYSSFVISWFIEDFFAVQWCKCVFSENGFLALSYKVITCLNQFICNLNWIFHLAETLKSWEFSTKNEIPSTDLEGGLYPRGGRWVGGGLMRYKPQELKIVFRARNPFSWNKRIRITDLCIGEIFQSLDYQLKFFKYFNSLNFLSKNSFL